MRGGGVDSGDGGELADAARLAGLGLGAGRTAGFPMQPRRPRRHDGHGYCVLGMWVWWGLGSGTAGDVGRRWVMV